MPSNIRAIVSGLDGTLSDVAERADRVLEASSSRDVFAVQSNNSDERLRVLEAAILSLTTQISNLLTSQQSRGNSGFRRNRSRSKSHTQNNVKWCSYHNQYGADARRCKPPCAFSVQIGKLTNAAVASSSTATNHSCRVFVTDTHWSPVYN